VITRIVATRDTNGKLIKVSRKLYGVSGEGLKLKADHKYRVVGEYDNPTGETRIKGAMAHMVGLFVPDDMSKWPKIDPSDPTYQRDLASLQVRGEDVNGQHGGHEGMKEGMKMDHGQMSHEQMDHSQMEHGNHQ
jgi:hypothetical protein